MNNKWIKYTKKELLSLPRRDWDCEGLYDSVLFVNTKEKHDSGYNLFVIIGCNGGIPVEIAGYMDDFRLLPFEECNDLSFAFDCSMNGVFRLHCDSHRIKVGINTSTTTFNFVKN